MKKLIIITLVFLALAVSAGATDLLTAQTSDVTTPSATYYSVESVYWPGGLCHITLEGTLGTAVCTILYKRSGSTVWTPVKRPAGIGHGKLLFEEENNLRHYVVSLPESCDIGGYVSGAGDSTSITLSVEP